jgi:hypothetical protein
MSHGELLQKHLLDRVTQDLETSGPIAPFVMSTALHAALPSGGIISTFAMMPYSSIEAIAHPPGLESPDGVSPERVSLEDLHFRVQTESRKRPILIDVHPDIDATVEIVDDEADMEVVPPLSGLNLLMEAARVSAERPRDVPSEQTPLLPLEEALQAQRRATSGGDAPLVQNRIFGDFSAESSSPSENQGARAKRPRTSLTPKTPAKTPVRQTRPPRDEICAVKPAASLSLAELFRASSHEDTDAIERVLIEAKEQSDPHGIFVQPLLTPVDESVGTCAQDASAFSDASLSAGEGELVIDLCDLPEGIVPLHRPSSADTISPIPHAEEILLGSDSDSEVSGDQEEDSPPSEPPCELERLRVSRSAEASGDLATWVMQQEKAALWIPEPLWVVQSRIAKEIKETQGYRVDLSQHSPGRPQPGSLEEFRIPHDKRLSQHVASGEPGFPDIEVPAHLQAEADDWKSLQQVRMLNRAGRAAIPLPIMLPPPPVIQTLVDKAVQDYHPPDVPSWPVLTDQAVARAGFVTPLLPRDSDHAKAVVTEASSYPSLPPTELPKKKHRKRGKRKRKVKFSGIEGDEDDLSLPPPMRNSPQQQKLSEFQKDLIRVRTHAQLTLSFLEEAPPVVPLRSSVSPRSLTMASCDIPSFGSSVTPYPSVSGSGECGFSFLDSGVPDVPEESALLSAKYLGDLWPESRRGCPPGPPFITPVSNAVSMYLTDLRQLVPEYSQVAADRNLIPNPTRSVLACPRHLQQEKGVPSFSPAAPVRHLDADFRPSGMLHDARLKPPISINPAALMELISQARSRIVTTSAQDWNLSTAQTIAIHLLRRAEDAGLGGEFMESLEDLLKVLQASDVLWTEGMKLDSVLLANLSILQRDSYLALCNRMDSGSASSWRAQPFLSESVFGLDDAGGRPLPFSVADRDLLLHLSDSDVYRLQAPDKVLLASEICFLHAEDVEPSDSENES